jgi:DNA (cytosine-5)-methyltransferase 1
MNNLYKPYTLDLVREREAQDKFKVVSLFAGFGGSSTGYRLAGGQVLAINEFVEAAQLAYHKNYPTTQIFGNDVREITGEIIMNMTGLKKGELDILDGSPPCSSFSTAGLREKGWGKEKKYSDTNQVTDDLFFEYARILKDLQPKFFIAENVKGITMGSAKHLLGSEQFDMFGDHENTIYHTLVNAGYRSRYVVLNAKHYGVPQTRERTIFIGVRNDLNKQISYPARISNNIPLSQAFEGITNTDKEIADADIARYAIGVEAKKLKPGEQSEKYFSLAKQSPDRYSDTLTASAGSISAASICHWSSRKFTVSEAKRIMGFPDDYYCGENYAHQIERLGRAVPPLLMYNVVKNLIG